MRWFGGLDYTFYVVDGVLTIDILVSGRDANGETVHCEHQVLLETDYRNFVSWVLMGSTACTEADCSVESFQFEWNALLFSSCPTTCVKQLDAAPEGEQKSPADDTPDISLPMKRVAHELKQYRRQYQCDWQKQAVPPARPASRWLVHPPIDPSNLVSNVKCTRDSHMHSSNSIF